MPKKLLLYNIPMKDYRALTELTTWSDNPRSILKEDFLRLKKQIQRLGQYKPLLVTSDGIVIGGNMRLEAMKALGMLNAWVSTIEFKQRDDKKWYACIDGVAYPGEFESLDQAMTEYALSDNDRAGSYDEDKLAEHLSKLPTLEDIYRFDLGKMTNIKELMSRYGPDLKEDEFDGTLPDEPKTVRGDVYSLGEHRLICGDATDFGDVQKLMAGKTARMVFTDPPYNVDYAGGMHADGTQTKRKKIMNDKMTPEEFFAFLYNSLGNMIAVTKGAFYVCMSSSELHNLWKAFTDNGGHWQTYIIWAKDAFTLSRADYQHQMEPMLYGLSEDEMKKVTGENGNFDSMPILYGWTEHEWYGGRKQGNVWNIPRPRISKEHPTMKPIELVGRAIRNSSLVGDIVLDLFGGSGSTLIAAEQTNRVCYMSELDPKYCDVIVHRWETLTGGKAKLV
jgi:DNA modification methylase